MGSAELYNFFFFLKFTMFNMTNSISWSVQNHSSLPDIWHYDHFPGCIKPHTLNLFRDIFNMFLVFHRVSRIDSLPVKIRHYSGIPFAGTVCQGNSQAVGRGEHAAIKCRGTKTIQWLIRQK